MSCTLGKDGLARAHDAPGRFCSFVGPVFLALLTFGVPDGRRSTCERRCGGGDGPPHRTGSPRYPVGIAARGGAGAVGVGPNVVRRQ